MVKEKRECSPLEVLSHFQQQEVWLLSWRNIRLDNILDTSQIFYKQCKSLSDKPAVLILLVAIKSKMQIL